MEDTENIVPAMAFDSPDNEDRGEFNSDPLAYQNDIEGVPQLDDSGDNSVESIMSHKWVQNAGWTFDVTLMGISDGSDRLRVSFDDLKTDAPYMLAQYVLRNKVGSRSGFSSPAGKIMDWARNHLDSHRRLILRVRRTYGMSGQFSDESKWESLRFTPMPNSEKVKAPVRVRVARKKSGRNRLKRQVMGTLKYGIRVPRNVKQALLMDQENGNTHWHDAIKKEMDALLKRGVFKKVSDKKAILKSAYQFAPLRCIFDVKQDLRRKARLVIGGHVVDASDHESYSSNMKTISMRLLLLIGARNNLKLLTADISSAYLYADTQEMVYTSCGPEFNFANGDIAKEGDWVTIVRALYGLSTSARQWRRTLSNTLTSIGYVATRFDQDVWMRRSKRGEYYEYLGTHTDDLVFIASDPQANLAEITKFYDVKSPGEPMFHLGIDYIKVTKGKVDFLELGTKTYIKEALLKAVETIGHALETSKTPFDEDYKPELDLSQFCSADYHTKFQKLVGICQWLVTLGRIDIYFAIMRLSQFSAAPRKGHYFAMVRVFKYLNHNPDVRIRIDPRDHVATTEGSVDFDKRDEFKELYPGAKEQIDLKHPIALMKEPSTSVYFDASFANDTTTGRSHTGVLVYVGSTPVNWVCKRQSTVETSTYSSEYVAGKAGVEEVACIRYALRSFGVKISKPTALLGDNQAMVNSVSAMKMDKMKRSLFVAMHCVRESYAAEMMTPYFVRSADNRSDGFTKALGTNLHSTLFQKILFNGKCRSVRRSE
jgi:hypothetical protein